MNTFPICKLSTYEIGGGKNRVDTEIGTNSPFISLPRLRTKRWFFLAPTTSKRLLRRP